MDEKIFAEFQNVKFADEYLCLFAARQRRIRKTFKIVTLLLSAGGIAAIARDWKLPSLLFLAISAVGQFLSLVENEIIPSEKNIEDVNKLRLLNYIHWNKLEDLYLSAGKHTEDELKKRFFECRTDAKEIEELDNSSDVKDIKKLKTKARIKVIEYLKTYHNA